MKGIECGLHTIAAFVFENVAQAGHHFPLRLHGRYRHLLPVLAGALQVSAQQLGMKGQPLRGLTMTAQFFGRFAVPNRSLSARVGARSSWQMFSRAESSGADISVSF